MFLWLLPSTLRHSSTVLLDGVLVTIVLAALFLNLRKLDEAPAWYMSERKGRPLIS